MSSTLLYHKTLTETLAKELKIAKEARRKGFDPAPAPEINITKDLAERVEALIGIKGLSARIRELERAGYGREEIALRIGSDFVEGRFGSYKKVEVIENAVRTAVAILTEGVVAAPIEGIARVEAGRNDDASEYIKIFYAGPIRSAGGTAQALSVLAADYIRRIMGFAAYHPREEEIGRYVLEVSEYERVSGLQYTPTDEEVKEIVRNCPICIDGDPTEEIEVGGYKDLERVATDKIRGGMVLVLTEGIAMKAAKIKQQVERLELEGWEWLATLVKSKGEKRKKDFLADLIAGRPVFGRPSAKGSFRLRYGRARNSGLSAVGINPTTMALLEFIATGTQIKPELPRKGNCVVPVDSIEGPTVLLKDGSLVRCGALPHVGAPPLPPRKPCKGLPASPVRALDLTQPFGTFDPTALREEVAEIVDLGEILIDYGDFLETNHRLVPGAYAHEWWLKELEARAQDEAEKWRLNTPSQAEALEIASRFAVPLHPAYTYLWEDITDEDKEYVAERICQAGILDEKTLFIPDDDGGRIKRILEDLLVPHNFFSKEKTLTKRGVPEGDSKILAIDEPSALLRCLGLNEDLKRDEAVRITTRNKAPTRIGVRMGRPEKSRERRMKPAPHSIFPLGEYGGKNRSLKEALKAKVIEVELQTVGGIEQKIIKNRNKGRDNKRSIDLWGYYQETMQQLGEDYTNTNKLEVKCVKGLISKQKVAEHLGKGILRAKHDVVVFKDGTIRYDLTNLPLTHFKPKEIGLSVAKAKELGYSYDLNGEELKSETQIVELKQQDIIISVDAAPYMMKVSHFVDSLLSQFYGLPPYYCASSKEDLIGQLVLGLAPHTSAGIVGRIIGFTTASACYAHPFFHAAKRRNCDGDEDSIILLLDALLNFSLSFLPEKRGGRMDAPLVLIPFINPKEVDKEAHNISIAREYPLEFYEAACAEKHPKEVVIETALNKIGDMKDSYGFGYTHETTDIAAGPLNSLYKRLATMIEKMEAQLRLARMIRAVDEKEVAETVIKNHFIRDIKGNLRAFGSQQMRCSKCNAKYRRIPLSGRCQKCGSQIVPTVHAAGIKKYLDVSLRIANEYHVSDYTRQRLELLQCDIDTLFPADERQKSLSDFM
ncbi:MAG: DNA polymerase II large subunit [Methanophagales archaeon]|nr:DNA polymerase II large subunit [Methanophagales archaeon]